MERVNNRYCNGILPLPEKRVKISFTQTEDTQMSRRFSSSKPVGSAAFQAAGIECARTRKHILPKSVVIPSI